MSFRRGASPSASEASSVSSSTGALWTFAFASSAARAVRAQKSIAASKTESDSAHHFRRFAATLAVIATCLESVRLEEALDLRRRALLQQRQRKQDSCL